MRRQPAIHNFSDLMARHARMKLNNIFTPHIVVSLWTCLWAYRLRIEPHLIAANWWSMVAMHGLGGGTHSFEIEATETVGAAGADDTDSRPRESFSISAPNWCRAVMADGVGSFKLWAYEYLGYSRMSRRICWSVSKCIFFACLFVCSWASRNICFRLQLAAVCMVT